MATSPRGARVLGVDACPGGWVGLADRGPDDPRSDVVGLRAYVADDITGLVAAAEDDGAVNLVAVDIPIGIPHATIRVADLLARQAVGSLASSVFLTPIREALAAPTHAEATRIARTVTGQGISVQAYGLRTRILEVDRYARTGIHRVVEVHPEVSFAQLAGRPLRTRKSTWAGHHERSALLRGVGVDVPADLGGAGLRAKPDDVLDAAVVWWSGHRVLAQRAVARPDPPEFFGDGPHGCIWT